jgi:transcription elongation factor Elf1
MQRRLNLTIPLACPHCLAELLATLDDLQQQANVRCPECGTVVELHPENVPMPPVYEPHPHKPLYCGIEF